MLNWMDKTHKTVYLLSQSLRLWPSQRLQLAMVINTRQVCCGYIGSGSHWTDTNRNDPQSHENAWCKGEIIEFPKHVSHQNFKHLQLKTDIHEKAVFTKIIGHVGHFRWLGPNVWWEISQIWIEYIKPIGQMSDEPWKFFMNTGKRFLTELIVFCLHGDSIM